jgi:hypothetical protein
MNQAGGVFQTIPPDLTRPKSQRFSRSRACWHLEACHPELPQGAKDLLKAFAIAFQIMFLSRGVPLRLPRGAGARVRPYKSQNVFLKNYSNGFMEILRRFSRFASFAPQNDMFLEMSTDPGKHR